MAKDQMYTQCRIERPPESEVKAWDEVWIPTELAVVGRRIKVDKGNSNDGPWIVVFKGVTKPWSWLKEHERDHLHQREASDI